MADARFAVAIWVGVAVLALAGWRGVRLGGGVLGALAGLGYAGSAIAVRGVGTPVEPPVVACAAAVGVYGLLAFWLYSLGAGPGAGVDGDGADDRRCRRSSPASWACSCSATACAPGGGRRWPPAWCSRSAGAIFLSHEAGGRDRVRSSRRRGDWVFAGSRTTTGSRTSSIAFIVASSSFTPAALTFSVTCSGRLAPMIAAETLSFCSTQATASWARRQAGLLGDRLQLLDPLEHVVLAASA